MSDAIEARKRDTTTHMTEAAGLRQVMKNARTAEREDLYRFAFERLCQVFGKSADDPTDPIAWRLEQSVCAFEESQGGRRASRTRPMVDRRGSVGTTKRWLTYREPSKGYIALADAGLWRLLGEAIPLDFPAYFTDHEIAVARYRIADAEQGRVSDPFLPALPRVSFLPGLG
jgi:hypothetical protein